jgi:hypothetical protein
LTDQEYAFDFLLTRYPKIKDIQLQGIETVQQFDWKSALVEPVLGGQFYAEIRLYAIQFYVFGTCAETAFNKLYDLVERFLRFRKSFI